MQLFGYNLPLSCLVPGDGACYNGDVKKEARRGGKGTVNAFYQSPLEGRHPYHVSIGGSGFGAHWHSELEILSVLEGGIRVATDDAVFEAGTGEAVLVGAAVPHEIESLPETAYLVIEAGAALLGEDYYAFWGRRFLSPKLALGECPRLRETLGAIAGWVRGHGEAPACEWELRALLFRLAAILAELPYAAEDSGVRERRLQSLRRMQSVLTAVAERYAEPFPVREAAALSGYEEKSFCRSFREVTGRTFHRYLNETRVAAAKRLLSEDAVSGSARTVAAIGEAVGFPEPKTFSRVFLAVTGKTPAAYRASSVSEKD